MLSFVEENDEITPQLTRPLELKIQTLFGEAVGATLNTHSQFLWVTRNGAVYLWDQTAPGFLAKHQNGCPVLPGGVLKVLQHSLQQSWQQMRAESETLAKTEGLDELRVDWLLGDPQWGPRIGETTYMGT